MNRALSTLALCVAAAFPIAPVAAAPHSADTTAPDGEISLSEVLRVIQLFNSDGFHCGEGTEDGFETGPGDSSCSPHQIDYAPQDWRVSLSELLRGIQFYNSGAYHLACPGTSEDGFAPYPGPLDICVFESENNAFCTESLPSVEGEGVREQYGWMLTDTFPLTSARIGATATESTGMLRIFVLTEVASSRERRCVFLPWDHFLCVMHDVAGETTVRVRGLLDYVFEPEGSHSTLYIPAGLDACSQSYFECAIQSGSTEIVVEQEGVPVIGTDLGFEDDCENLWSLEGEAESEGEYGGEGEGGR